MVNSILTYFEAPIKVALPFLNQVDAPVFKMAIDNRIFKGLGQEKQEICISDQVGKALYIRSFQMEQVKQTKSFTSCQKDYAYTSRCKAVYYSFGNEQTISADKIKNQIIKALNSLPLSNFPGDASDIEITINGSSTDMEKIFFDETGVKYEGNQWPTLAAVEFTLSYQTDNCEPCDIEENCLE
jgi:hypothetical protein